MASKIKVEGSQGGLNSFDSAGSRLGDNLSFQPESNARSKQPLSAKFRSFLKRCPGINFMYFVLDDQPQYDDILALLNNIALLAALVFTISGAIPAMVEIDELELADCRFDVWGEYGCYNFAKFHSFKPSKAFANRSAIATYTMAVVLLMSILMIFGVSTLSTAGEELDEDKKRQASAKLIGGRIISSKGYDDMPAGDGSGGIPAVALAKWWNVMRWLAFIEMGLLIVGIQFMFLAFIYLIMIKFPSEYMHNRCFEYGYELLGSPIGVLANITTPAQGYPNWGENIYTGESLEPNGRARACDVYVHNNRNADGSFAQFDDKPGMFASFFTTEAMEYDPSQDWWAWSFAGLVPILGLTLIVAGYAAYYAEKFSKHARRDRLMNRKWVKVLITGDTNDPNPPMFYPKTSLRSSSKLPPRRLHVNEVFLLLGKANDELWEVLTVPWSPIVDGDEFSLVKSRYTWPWARLHTVHELGAMYKAKVEMDVAERKQVGRQLSDTMDEEEVAAVFDIERFLNLYHFLNDDINHERHEDDTSDETAAAESFFEKLLFAMDHNNDNKLHLAEVLGPLGVLDIRRGMNINKIKIERPTTAKIRPGVTTLESDDFGKCITDDDFRDLFPYSNEVGKDHYQCLYYDRPNGGEKQSVWELMCDAFPHVDHKTMLRLNSLERGFVHIKNFSVPIEAKSAAEAFGDDFGVNDYYLGCARALKRTRRDDLEDSVAFLHHTIPEKKVKSKLRHRKKGKVAPVPDEHVV